MYCIPLHLQTLIRTTEAMFSESWEFLDYTLIDIGPDLFIGSNVIDYYHDEEGSEASDSPEGSWDVIETVAEDGNSPLQEKESIVIHSRNIMPQEETDMNESKEEKSALVSPILQDAVGKENRLEPTSPMGDRWSICDPSVDLSGSYALAVDDEFYQEYEEYLTGLGIGYFIRKVALQVISQTSEIIEQTKDGKEMRIIGSNPKGKWDRTFISSGSDFATDVGEDFVHDQMEMKLANAEDVLGEAWWEEKGTVHRSFLRGGGADYGGGDFESKRYFDENNTYICESLFHPENDERKTLSVTWKFVKSH